MRTHRFGIWLKRKLRGGSDGAGAPQAHLGTDGRQGRDVIMTHWPQVKDGLANPHAVTGQIVPHALRFANAVDPGDCNPPVRGAQVFFFGGGATKIPNTVVDANRGCYNDVLSTLPM